MSSIGKSIKPKIGLIGCSGLGKSFISFELSKKLGIPFLSSKEITRPILKKFDFRYGDDGFVENFLSEKDIEFELVDSRIESENRFKKEGFVTDRTTLECFCYAFLSLQTYTEDEFSLLEMICKTNMTNYTHLFKIPINAGWLEENGVRTLNAHLQRHIDILIQSVIEEWDVSVQTVPLEIARSNQVVDFILQNMPFGF